jgi:hypothetical protein
LAIWLSFSLMKCRNPSFISFWILLSFNHIVTARTLYSLAHKF